MDDSKKKIIYFIGALAAIFVIFYGYYQFVALPRKETAEIEAQNKINQSTTDLKAKFLAECQADEHAIWQNDKATLDQLNNQATQDCHNGHYSFSPESPFQCFPNLLDKDGKKGLLVILADSAYLDACIKYNMDLVKP